MALAKATGEYQQGKRAYPPNKWSLAGLFQSSGLMERRLPWNLAQLNAIAFLKVKGEVERLDYDYLGAHTCLIASLEWLSREMWRY